MDMKALAALLVAGILAGAGVVAASAQDSAEKPPEFTEAYMSDPANIAAGKEILDRAVPTLPRQVLLSWQGAQTQAAPIHAQVRLRPGDRRLSQDAALEGGL